MTETRLASFGHAVRRRWWWVLIAVVLVLIVVATLAVAPSHDRPDAASDASYFTVEEGPLTISVDTAGTISSSQAVVIKSEVEGRTTILSLAEEGVQVKAGDMLIELDSSELEDDRLEQDIVVQNADASFIQAREKVAVVKQEAEVDIDAAKVAHELALLELEKYIDPKGEYTQELLKAETKITIAEAKLQQATDKLDWSRKLKAEGFVTNSQFKADELTQRETQVELEIAQGELRLLKEFTYKGKLAELQSVVKQKAFELAKTEHNATSSVVDAEASLRAKEAALAREKDRLQKTLDQISKCRIEAPVDGMVVYATSNQPIWRSVEPLAEGGEVRERQELIRLPTTARMQADVKVHESMLKKVRSGLAVNITTEAMPERVFNGRVEKISVLPDSQSRWMNPDLKVYTCQVEIDGDTAGLRPGNSCRAEIMVEQFDEALYVPIQAVLRVDGEPTVYLKGPRGLEPRPIEVGLDNNRMIQIVSGLEPGEQVLLSPPLLPSTMKVRRPGKQRRKKPTQRGESGAAEQQEIEELDEDEGADDVELPDDVKNLLDSIKLD